MKPDQVRRSILWIALIALLAWSIYGIQHQRLFQQDIWTHAGLRRFLIFAAAYVVIFAAVFVWKPGLFPAGAGIAVAIYTVAAAGPFAVLAVALVLLSAFALGRSILRSPDAILATLLGLAVYAFVLSLAAHAKINYHWTYLAALALPMIWGWRDVADLLRRIPGLFRPRKLRPAERLGAAALIFVLMLHWLVALEPEVGSDALAVHLAVPAEIAWRHLWPFDVTQHLWAVMPMNGDWCFTLCYLLGGEAAARLLNFALLLGLAGLLGAAIRKWLPLAPALFLVALFAATPLIQLVTGSLFVENLWALLSLGALVSVDLYRERDNPRYLYLAFVLLGSAAATKFGAFAFAAPLVLIAGRILWEKRGSGATWSRAAIASACFGVFAAPPYLAAYVKTGSPAFPYLTKLFPSRYPALAAGAGALPPGQHLGIGTPFDLTFHTSLFYEVQDGATGFQYFLLLPFGVLLVRRKWPPLALESGFAAALFGMLAIAILPDVRYLYPALAPATLFLSAAAIEVKQIDPWLFRCAGALAVSIFLLDLYFLPASGWMHKDFVTNPASASVRAAYIAAYAPERALIADLNRVHPGAPTAFFESTSDAGLRAPAFTTSWHTAGFNNRMSVAASVADCLRILREDGVKFVIAPRPDSGIRITTTPEEAFLRRCTIPQFTSGKFFAGSVKDPCENADSLPVASAGEYDDLDAHVAFQGLWSRGRFPQARNGTLTWSDAAGARAVLHFEGSGVTYAYTKAFNRGIAEIFMDGASAGTLDLYAPDIQWGASTPFEAASPGEHTFEIRVTGRKTPAATGAFVDVDELIVR